MPRTLMQSVVSQLQKERTRLEDELHHVTVRPDRLRESLFAGEQRYSDEANHFGCWTQANSGSSEGTLGED
jgi:hypothetical protein